MARQAYTNLNENGQAVADILGLLAGAIPEGYYVNPDLHTQPCTDLTANACTYSQPVPSHVCLKCMVGGPEVSFLTTRCSQRPNF